MPKLARPTTAQRTAKISVRPKLISAADAAEILGVSRSTLHRIRHQLRYTRVGGQILIHEDSLDAYVRRNTFGGAR